MLIKILDKLLGRWFDSRFEKSLENHKSELQKKVYVSKVRFDAEFEVYREISLYLFDAKTSIKDLHMDALESDLKQELKLAYQMIEPDFEDHAGFRTERKKRRRSGVENLKVTIEKLSRKLEGDAPVIPKEIFAKYSEVDILLTKVLSYYNSAIQIYNLVDDFPTEELVEAQKNFELFLEKHEKINEYIRNYLNTLEIIQ